jgi:hypothetical protein
MPSTRPKNWMTAPTEIHKDAVRHERVVCLGLLASLPSLISDSRADKTRKRMANFDHAWTFSVPLTHIMRARVFTEMPQAAEEVKKRLPTYGQGAAEMVKQMKDFNSMVKNIVESAPPEELRIHPMKVAVFKVLMLKELCFYYANFVGVPLPHPSECADRNRLVDYNNRTVRTIREKMWMLYNNTTTLPTDPRQLKIIHSSIVDLDAPLPALPVEEDDKGPFLDGVGGDDEDPFMDSEDGEEEDDEEFDAKFEEWLNEMFKGAEEDAFEMQAIHDCLKVEMEEMERAHGSLQLYISTNFTIIEKPITKEVREGTKGKGDGYP